MAREHEKSDIVHSRLRLLLVCRQSPNSQHTRQWSFYYPSPLYCDFNQIGLIFTDNDIAVVGGLPIAQQALQDPRIQTDKEDTLFPITKIINTRQHIKMVVVLDQGSSE